MDNDCAIGKNGNLLCRLTEDMKFFRTKTINSAVIMGRKTYESLPKRPLANRDNLILSTTANQIEGAEVFNSVENLFNKLRTISEEIFVIGGATVYEQLAQYCDEAFITRIYENFGGDVFFRDIERDKQWELIETSNIIETDCRKIRFYRYINKERVEI